MTYTTLNTKHTYIQWSHTNEWPPTHMLWSQWKNQRLKTICKGSTAVLHIVTLCRLLVSNTILSVKCYCLHTVSGVSRSFHWYQLLKPNMHTSDRSLTNVWPPTHMLWSQWKNQRLKTICKGSRAILHIVTLWQLLVSNTILSVKCYCLHTVSEVSTSFHWYQLLKPNMHTSDRSLTNVWPPTHMLWSQWKNQRLKTICKGSRAILHIVTLWQLLVSNTILSVKCYCLHTVSEVSTSFHRYQVLKPNIHTSDKSLTNVWPPTHICCDLSGKSKTQDYLWRLQANPTEGNTLTAMAYSHLLQRLGVPG